MASQDENADSKKVNRVLKAHDSHPEAPAKKKIRTDLAKDEDCSGHATPRRDRGDLESVSGYKRQGINCIQGSCMSSPSHK